jgi:hypothetical protein
MNYISLLTRFFTRVSADTRINPTHVSMYMALFQLWNRNKFRSPIAISRSDLMVISKISSYATYHKCIKQLHNFGYIRYSPSYNPMRGSWVYMLNFDHDSDKADETDIHTGIREVIDKHKISDDRGSRVVVVPYINNTNNKNTTNNTNEGEETHARPKSSDSNLAVEKIPASLQVVKDFFREENFPELEAEKFYNHFQSNGWQVAGKTPMQDWRASARSWILKIPNYPVRTATGSQPDQSLNNVNYDEPL